MFKYKNITPAYKDTCVGGMLYKILYSPEAYPDEEFYVCLMTSWTMGCCGARSLFQFENRSAFWTEEFTQEFLEFLDETDREHYYSREVFFMLTKDQAHDMEALVQHEDTKAVDHFTNRGNGGRASMTLYRWSSCMPDEEDDDEEDF